MSVAKSKIKVITNLKEIREKGGLTQQELAEAVGVRRETILHLENNRYNPSLELALKIAQVFDKSVEEIFRLNEGESSWKIKCVLTVEATNLSSNNKWKVTLV